MHQVGKKSVLQHKPTTTQNAASQIMNDPTLSAIVRGGIAPSWDRMFRHIEHTKEQAASIVQSVVAGYNILVSRQKHHGEPEVLANRMLEELTETLNRLNQLSMSHEPNIKGYRGDARTPAEAEAINFTSMEATEIFQNFLSENTLTTLRLQEYFTAAQLEIQREADAANGLSIDPDTKTPVKPTN